MKHHNYYEWHIKTHRGLFSFNKAVAKYLTSLGYGAIKPDNWYDSYELQHRIRFYLSLMLRITQREGC